MLMNEGGQGEEIREVGATTGPVCKRQPPLSSGCWLLCKRGIARTSDSLRH